MSQYTIPALNSNHTIIVGWNSPLASFFIQVYDRAIEAEIESDECDECSDADADPMILWLGATLGELPTIAHLQAAIANYAIIPQEVLNQLQANYDQAWVPSPPQQQTRQWIAENSIAATTHVPATCTIENLQPLRTDLIGKAVWVVCELHKGQWNPNGARSQGIICKVVRALNPTYQTLMIESEGFEEPEPFMLDRQGVLWDLLP